MMRGCAPSPTTSPTHPIRTPPWTFLGATQVAAHLATLSFYASESNGAEVEVLPRCVGDADVLAAAPQEATGTTHTCDRCRSITTAAGGKTEGWRERRRRLPSAILTSTCLATRGRSWWVALSFEAPSLTVLIQNVLARSGCCVAWQLRPTGKVAARST